MIPSHEDKLLSPDPSPTEIPKWKKCQEAGHEQQEIIINERRNE